MIDKRTLSGPLRVPIDESNDIQKQIAERFRAIYEYFEIKIDAPDADAALICALAEEAFPSAFKRVAQKPQDLRIKIPEPQLLREVVSALLTDNTTMLDQRGQKFADEAKKHLPRRPSKKAISDALAKSKGTPWYKENEKTIRDYLYREDHERATRNKQLISALKKTRDEIFKNHPFDTPHVDD